MAALKISSNKTYWEWELQSEFCKRHKIIFYKMILAHSVSHTMLSWCGWYYPLRLCNCSPFIRSEKKKKKTQWFKYINWNHKYCTFDQWNYTNKHNRSTIVSSWNLIGWLFIRLKKRCMGVCMGVGVGTWPSPKSLAQNKYFFIIQKIWKKIMELKRKKKSRFQLCC